jgi:hypothetical protein
MKSCLDCKYTEDTMFDDARKCTCEKSAYCEKIVDSRDLCKEFEEAKNWENQRQPTARK